MRPAALKDGLAASRIRKLPKRIDAEVNVAARAHIEQLSPIGPAAPRQAGRVERDELTEETGTGTVLGDHLLEQPVLVVHASLAATGVHLRRDADDIARTEERLDETHGAALEPVLDIRIKRSHSRHRQRPETRA